VNEARLIDKLRLIEALSAGATTDGEKAAAGNAKQRPLAVEGPDSRPET